MLAAPGVTLRLNGLTPVPGLVHLLVAAPAPPEQFALIRSMTAGQLLACPIAVLPSSAPDRTHSRPRSRERSAGCPSRATELVKAVQVLILTG